MSDCDSQPPPIPEQQHRLATLRILVSNGIPTILWGEDALRYAHSVPTALFSQKVIVPDVKVEAAASILQGMQYIVRQDLLASERLVERRGPIEGYPLYPKGILMQNLGIADKNLNKPFPPPSLILILPQSYFDFDVRFTSRFQPISPPLDSSNDGILVPKYHTFLEGLIEAFIRPPSGDLKSNSKLDQLVYIGYLVGYRENYDDDLRKRQPGSTLSPIERDILSEVETEGAAWFLSIYFWERRPPNADEIAAFLRQPVCRHSVFSVRHDLVNTGKLSSHKQVTPCTLTSADTLL